MTRRCHSFLRAWAALTGVLALAACQAPPVDLAPARPIVYQTGPVAAPVSGRLFQAASYRPAFEDPRARMPGDILTVQITEKVSASQKSSSSIDRSGSVSGGVSAIPGIKAKELNRDRNFNLGGESDNSFSGQGDATNDNTFQGSITATVQEVLPNGHLLVVGEKQIGVHQNVDVLRFSGTVDPRFIRPGNVVSSTQVANVRIESRSRGAIGEAQAIGWLGRVFLNVFPF